MSEAVLVVGGAGYIGSHVSLALRRSGFLPVVFDDLSSGHAWAVQWGPMVEGDIRDATALAAALAKWDCRAVIHLAGCISVAESKIDPLKYYDINVAGSLALFRAMQDAGTGILIFSSSAAVYGNARHGLVTESAPVAPINPYGASKAMIESVLQDMAASHEWRAVALRFFNAAAADPEGRIGEAHLPETHLIPSVLDAARAGRTMTVHGADYETPDGTCVRDYIHVDDIAEAHVLALKFLRAANTPVFEAINLGSNRGYSVLEILKTIAHATGLHVPYRVGPRRAGDPAILVASNEKAHETLGWQMRRSDIDTMIADAWRWMQRQEAVAGLIPA
ncbi:MAG TPA: UDP-glucose 4-epimerase GalE [Terriglobia bacterium]|nr:UDP-glucose 4-epimerase GalE [Terriglobia bacterium]